MSGDRPCPPDPYRTADGWYIIPPPHPSDLLVLLDELSEPVTAVSPGRRRLEGRAP